MTCDVSEVVVAHTSPPCYSASTHASLPKTYILSVLVCWQRALDLWSVPFVCSEHSTVRAGQEGTPQRVTAEERSKTNQPPEARSLIRDGVAGPGVVGFFPPPLCCRR